jgi:hypothetical protein
VTAAISGWIIWPIFCSSDIFASSSSIACSIAGSFSIALFTSGHAEAEEPPAPPSPPAPPDPLVDGPLPPSPLDELPPAPLDALVLVGVDDEESPQATGALMTAAIERHSHFV